MTDGMIINKSEINFINYHPNVFETNYNGNKYKIASINNEIIKLYNNNEYKMLSMIPKKNNKNRYYITFMETYSECDSCDGKCFSYEYCRGKLINCERYSSTFVGNNLDIALSALYSD